MNECTAVSAGANHSRSLQTIDKWEVEAAWRMEELQLLSLHAARLQLSRLTAELFWVLLNMIVSLPLEKENFLKKSPLDSLYWHNAFKYFNSYKIRKCLWTP